MVMETVHTPTHNQTRRSTLANLNIDSIPEELSIPKVVTRRRSQPVRSKPSSAQPTNHSDDTVHSNLTVLGAVGTATGDNQTLVEDDTTSAAVSAAADCREESEGSDDTDSEEEEEDSDSDSGFSGSNESGSRTNTLERG